MGERCSIDDYALRGATFEVWTDGTLGNSGYPGWWLSAKTEEDAKKCGVSFATVLTGDEFSPPLTETELCRIGDALIDRWSS